MELVRCDEESRGFLSELEACRLLAALVASTLGIADAAAAAEVKRVPRTAVDTCAVVLPVAATVDIS